MYAGITRAKDARCAKTRLGSKVRTISSREHREHASIDCLIRPRATDFFEYRLANSSLYSSRREERKREERKDRGGGAKGACLSSSAGTDFRNPVFPDADAAVLPFAMKTAKVNWVEK